MIDATSVKELLLTSLLLVWCAFLPPKTWGTKWYARYIGYIFGATGVVLLYMSVHMLLNGPAMVADAHIHFLCDPCFLQGRKNSIVSRFTFLSKGGPEKPAP